jgi:3-oxoacyl-[acyl-carrier-protein] synthase-1
MEQIQMGKQDIVFAGGGEEVHWTMSVLFDAMGAMSSKYNDAPTTASGLGRGHIRHGICCKYFT